MVAVGYEYAIKIDTQFVAQDNNKCLWTETGMVFPPVLVLS